MVKKGNKSIVSQIPGLKGFGVDGPERRTKKCPVCAISKITGHGLMKAGHHVLPFQVRWDHSLPFCQDFFRFRHRKSHKGKARFLHVRRLFQRKADLFPAGPFLIGQRHQPERRNEPAMHHVPVGIDTMGLQKCKKPVLSPHPAPAGSNLSLCHMTGIKILPLQGKAHIILAVKQLPHREGGYIKIPFLRKEHPIHIKNHLFHPVPPV